MSEGESGSKCVAGPERGHVILPDEPCGCDERGKQSSREDSAGLQRIDAEDLAFVGGVVAPLVDHIEDFGAENPTKYNDDAKIPGLVSVVAKALGIADTDPEAEQDAESDQESVGRQEKASNAKELGKH